MSPLLQVWYDEHGGAWKIGPEIFFAGVGDLGTGAPLASVCRIGTMVSLAGCETGQRNLRLATPLAPKARRRSYNAFL